MSDLTLLAASAARARPEPRPWVQPQVMIARALRLALRNPDGLITALALPVMLMLMFVYLFGGAINTGPGGHYVDYVVSGVLLVCVGFGAATTAVSVAHDLKTGIIDRLRWMDVRGEALINGHVVASVIRNMASAVLVVAVGLAIGFRPHGRPLDIVAAGGILALWVLAISWFAAAIGLLVRSPEAAQGVTVRVSFLPYPSSAFVPLHTMPAGVRAFAQHQPVTQVVDAVRALLLGAPVGSSAGLAIVWSVGILLASVALAGVLFRRRVG